MDGEVAFYEWYSAGRLMVDAILDVTKGCASVADVAVLDMGCGTSPLLFHLARHHGFRKLHGADFSPSAIEFMAAQAAKAKSGECDHLDSDNDSVYKGTAAESNAPTGDSEEEEEDADADTDTTTTKAEGDPAGVVQFTVEDARDLSRFKDGSIDLVLDKGLLDCFINAQSGWPDARVYLKEVARILTPGAFLHQPLPANHQH